MDILFYRYGSICEEDIIRCFKDSGHNYVTIDNEITDKNLTSADTLKLVDEALSKKSFDCVFTVNFFPAISELCNIYHIRYISWIVDSPVLELFSASIKNPWNRVFIFDRIQYEEICAFNPGCIFHYPLAVDTDSKQRAIAVGDTGKYRCDLSFVGSLYSEKDPLNGLKDEMGYLRGYVDGICEAQMHVYGYYFIQELITDLIIKDFKACMPYYYVMKADNFLSDRIVIGQYYLGNHITSMERQRLIGYIADHFPIDVYTRSSTESIRKANCRGGCMTETEMPIIFHESKINLNPTSKAIRSGIPLRAFDIFACEGFMLSNYQTELAELFVPGEDFVCYDSMEQALELIAYYLDHEKERMEIAHNGYLKVKERYSYTVRLNRLLLKAFEN